MGREEPPEAVPGEWLEDPQAAIALTQLIAANVITFWLLVNGQRFNS